MQWFTHVVSCQIECFSLMLWSDVFIRVATVLFIALHNSLIIIQSSEELLFLYNILVEVISRLSLEICICTYSLVIDHMGCSINVWISFILLFFLSMLCRVARWPIFHRPGRYFTANLAEAGKRPAFWKSVPKAGILKINNLT